MFDGFSRAEQHYLEPPRESQVLGRCYICGWPVHSTSWYEYTHNGLRHCDCKPIEKKEV
jgi:hypothetical protein